MIKVKYNIGSKPHLIEFNNSKELGDWIIENYKFGIINIDVD